MLAVPALAPASGSASTAGVSFARGSSADRSTPVALRASRRHRRHRQHNARRRQAAIAHQRHQAALAVPPPSSAPGAAIVDAPTGPWPTSGNETIGDCSFASAADWELITQGSFSDSEAQLIREFHEAGGSDSEGLSSEELAGVWLARGIAGVRVRLSQRPVSALESLVSPGTAAIAVINVPVGQRFAPVPYKLHGRTVTAPAFTIEAGGSHILVVAGYNSTGPEVVTWGATFQLTWAEWTQDNPKLYEAARVV
jgi:hypothetical protein